MNIKSISSFVLSTLLGTAIQPTFATYNVQQPYASTTVRQPTTLLSVYKQALKSDPTFQKAQADWMAAKQSSAIAWGNYLPNINITGSYTSTKTKAYSDGGTAWLPTGATTGKWQTTPAGYTDSPAIKSSAYSITATQQIFNMAAWSGISMANANVKAATASYLAANQALIQRTLSAYFQVLQDYEALRFNEASQKALYQTLQTNREQNRVGLLAITDVYNAEASFDQVNAQEYTLKAKLNTDLENLRAITNTRYTTLYGIRGQLPLMTPSPANINAWTNIATKQSYLLQAKIYATQAAKANMGVQNSAWLPSIAASANYSGGNPTGLKKDSTSTAVGLSLNYTPFAGGANFANSKQARYQYLSASADEQTAYRDVISSTRQAYLGITAGKQTILADKKAIQSAQLSLDATKAGYKVGTRTMVNILDATKALYQQKKQYADDQYAYLNSIVLLKQSAGTLSYEDVKQISRWLRQRTYLTRAITTDYKARQKKHSAIKKTKTKKAKKSDSSKRKVQKPQSLAKKSLAHKAATMMPSYRIQIFATKNKDSIRQYEKALMKNKNISIKYQKPWYRVYYGNYKSHRSAQQALLRVKKQLQITNAFIQKT